MTMPCLELIRGDTWRMPWLWKQADGAPINLTGVSVRWQLRNCVDGYLFISAVNDDERITVDQPDSGLIVVDIPYAVTENIRPGTYLCDMELTFTDGTRISSGSISVCIKGDVTVD